MEELTNEEKTKILQNEQNSNHFKVLVDEYLSNKMQGSGILILGNTPFSLQIAGAKELPLSITQTTLQNIINPENILTSGHTSGHNIDVEVVKDLPNMLNKPIIVMNDKNNNLRAIVKDDKDNYLLCHITLNKRDGRFQVNRIGSMYEKNNLANFIERAFDNKLIKAINIEEADKLFQSIGCQSSKEETSIISFDNSIAYTTKNVKYPADEKSSTKESQQHTEETAHLPEEKHKIIGIETGGKQYYYINKSDIGARDIIKLFSESKTAISDFEKKFDTQELVKIEKEQCKNIVNEKNHEYFLGISADKNTVSFLQGDNKFQKPLDKLMEIINKPNKENTGSDSMENSNKEFVEQNNEKLNQVIKELSVPEGLEALTMEREPNFKYVISEENFKQINEQAQEDINIQKTQETQETQETNKENKIQEETSKDTEKNEEVNEITTKRYTDISQVNAEMINDVENNTLSDYTVENEIVDDEENSLMTALHKAADENDSNAQNILGVCYFTGMNVLADEVKAIQYFEKAADQDIASAQRNLAIVLENSENPDKERVIKLYEAAAKQNDSFALNNLGACYLTGDGVKKDVRKAVQYFEMAVKQNDDYAMVNLADCYSVGNGVRKNDKKAFDLYKMAAEKGNIAAIKSVADSLLNGTGTMQNYSEALKYYEMAASKGDMASAQTAEKLKEKLSPQKHELDTSALSDVRTEKELTINEKTKNRSTHEER